jgi:hypothetical protein
MMLPFYISILNLSYAILANAASSPTEGQPSTTIGDHVSKLHNSLKPWVEQFVTQISLTVSDEAGLHSSAPEIWALDDAFRRMEGLLHKGSEGVGG